MAFHSYTHLIGRLFNAYPFGPPSRVTGTSAWTCVDHSVSRLPPRTKERPVQPRLHYGSRPSWGLTSHVTATRWFIMQKARRHRQKTGSDRLQAHGFRYCFTPLAGVLFTFPSRYWSTIGLTGVFSLAGWTPRIQTGLLVSRPTQDATRPHLDSRTGLSPPTVELSRTFRSPSAYHSVVLQPLRCVATTQVWAPPRSLAATGGIILIFFSCGY